MGTVLAAIGGFLTALAPAVEQLASKPSILDQIGNVVNKIVVPIFSLFLK